MTDGIKGVLAPVVTPFKADLSPDPERFITHCQWLVSQRCGLAVFGTNSEANSMSGDERETLLDALVAAGVDPSRMMPGTGCCSITETVRLTAHAVKRGCAGVLMLPPFYYKQVTEDGLFRYFSEVIQRVGDDHLKIYLYHIPPIAIVGITPMLVERLLKVYPDTIAGMKDSSGDWVNTKAFLDAFSKTGFDVFVGSDSFLLENLRHGGVGTISATANVNPGGIYALYDRVNPKAENGTLKAGNADEANAQHSTSNAQRPMEDGDPAEELQRELNEVREVFADKRFPSMIAAMKQAIAIYRNDPAWARVRPPLVELTNEQVSALESALKGIGFVMPLGRSPH
jgi:4-hydroxy-tetrahydrodipicolinate synthase